MKKCIAVFLVMMLLSSFAFADIEESVVRNKVAAIIKSIKSEFLNTAINLGNYKSDIQEILVEFPNALSASDKATLQGLNTIANNIKNELDIGNAYIETNLPSIK